MPRHSAQKAGLVLGTDPDSRSALTYDAAMWVFEKFLIDQAGNVVARFSPRTEPEDPRLVDAVGSLLA